MEYTVGVVGKERFKMVRITHTINFNTIITKKGILTVDPEGFIQP